MALKPLTNILESIPFKGGMVSKCEKAQLPFGGFSDVCNMRAVHTAGEKKTFKQRKGQYKKHTGADGTNKVLSLFHFSKGQRDENHFFAQFSDGDIHEATDEPENGKQTAAAFGTEVFSGSASQIPASWSVLEDLLIHSNGVDQHKVYAGTDNYVEALIKYESDATPPTIPTIGIDYTKEVTDGLSATYAVLNNLDVFGNDECLFIYSPVRINRLYWTIPTGNGVTATGSIWYRESDNTWENTATIHNFVDSTKGTDTTLSTSGSMVWDLPGDEVPCYMYGRVGFWYMFQTNAKFTSQTVHITHLTYGTDHDAAGSRTSFHDIVNIWSGESLPVIQTVFYDASASAYKTRLMSHGWTSKAEKQAVYLIGTGDLTSIGGMTTSDYLYFFTLDQIQGIYIDVGDRPNTTSTTTFASGDITVWCGADFQTVGTLSDQTSGLGNSGWITWARAPYNSSYYPEKTMGDTGTIGTTPYYGYLYRVKVSTATVSVGVQISIETLPFFDRLHLTDTTLDMGIGLCSSKWKDRMCYVFDRYPYIVYVSERGKPMVLNGPDHARLRAGDGRTNKVVCMWPFHNELAIWQEEKGDEGGTLTLWQGDNPSEFSRGKLVLSTKHGTFNAKSAIVVDGIRLPGSDTLKTLMFWLSTAGVFMSDGASVWIVSDDIAELFDSTDTTNCLRRGYENDHWIGYDRTYNIIRIGLVTGTGTVPNTFRALDLEDFAWYKDDLEQELSCIVEAEGNSTGKIPVLQYGGGVDDGTVYQLNYGTNDVTTAIDAYIQMEFYHHGMELEMGNILVGMKVQAAAAPGIATCTVTPYANGVAQTALTLSMLLENTSEAVRRHKTGVGIASEQMSLKLQNATASEEIHLFDVAVEINVNVDK